MLNDEISPIEAAFQARPHLYILSGGKSLSGAKRAIGRKDFGAEKTLSEALTPIQGEFDFVLIDTSPAWDALTINALFYCTELLIPISLEALSLNSLAEFNKRVGEVQKFNPGLNKTHLLPTFADGRVKKSKEVLEILEKHHKSDLYHSIRYCSKLSECNAFGQTIFEYAPKSTGARDYERAVERILKT